VNFDHIYVKHSKKSNNTHSVRSFYEKVDEYFPKEQVFEWDPRKNTLEELCQFLEISPCPKKGKAP